MPLGVFDTALKEQQAPEAERLENKEKIEVSAADYCFYGLDQLDREDCPQSEARPTKPCRIHVVKGGIGAICERILIEGDRSCDVKQQQGEEKENTSNRSGRWKEGSGAAGRAIARTCSLETRCDLGRPGRTM